MMKGLKKERKGKKTNLILSLPASSECGLELARLALRDPGGQEAGAREGPGPVKLPKIGRQDKTGKRGISFWMSHSSKDEEVFSEEPRHLRGIYR